MNELRVRLVQYLVLAVVYWVVICVTCFIYNTASPLFITATVTFVIELVTRRQLRNAERASNE